MKTEQRNMRARQIRQLEAQARVAQAQRGLRMKPMAFHVRRALADWPRYYPVAKA